MDVSDATYSISGRNKANISRVLNILLLHIKNSLPISQEALRIHCAVWYCFAAVQLM